MWWIISAVLALGVGVYVGLGLPGMRGREDRVITHGRARRLQKHHIHWFKTKQR